MRRHNVTEQADISCSCDASLHVESFNHIPVRDRLAEFLEAHKACRDSKDVGPCTDQLPIGGLLPGGADCVLNHGHTGAHVGDNGSRWHRIPPAPPVPSDTPKEQR